MQLRDFRRRSTAGYLLGGAIAIGALAVAFQVLGPPGWSAFAPAGPRDVSVDKAGAVAEEHANADASNAAETVEPTPSQLRAFKVEPVGYRIFPVQDQAAGAIDFNEDLSAQVFTPYQGRIVSLYAKVGDDVEKGQTLFTIESPDLIQAESTLITTAGLLQLTTKTLARTKALFEAKGAAQKDLEQAVSDQQAAEGNFKAAQDAVRIFGKTAAEID